MFNNVKILTPSLTLLTRAHTHISEHFQSNCELAKIMWWEGEIYLIFNYHTHGSY